MSTTELLPASAGPFERGLGAALTDALPVPIETILDPEMCPAKFLPFLAAHESVDLWFNDWPVARKRQMISENLALSELKGTHKGAVRYLEFVDAEVVDTLAYPARFVAGQSAAGITPVNFPPFKARYLIKVALTPPANAFRVGSSAAGIAAFQAVSNEPIRRAKQALLVSKAPETEYRVTFAWRRPLTFRDAPAFAEARPFGAYTDRKRL